MPLPSIFTDLFSEVSRGFADVHAERTLFFNQYCDAGIGVSSLPTPV